MDEGTSEQLENSNLQDQERGEQQHQPQQHDEQSQQKHDEQAQHQQQSQSSQHHNNNELSSEHQPSLSTSSSINPSASQKDQSVAEDLFTSKRWGSAPTRQDTPWELPPSPLQAGSSAAAASSAASNQNSITNNSIISNNNSSASSLIGCAPTNPIGNKAPTLPPGIPQSGDSFRSANSVNDFSGHGQAAAAAAAAAVMANNFGAVDSMSAANGIATSLGHMGLGGGPGVLHSTSRFDQPWRAPAAKQHQSAMGSGSPFANHNLMNPATNSMQKSMLNNSGNGGSSFVGMPQSSGEFARAPGPASSIMDNNTTSKPFGMANRSSTWSAFGSPAPNESEPEWPKSTSSGISAANSTQPSNAFDMVPEFEPGKPWRGSMLMKSVEDDPTMTPGSMARSLAPQRKTIWSDEIL